MYSYFYIFIFLFIYIFTTFKRSETEALLNANEVHPGQRKRRSSFQGLCPLALVQCRNQAALAPGSAPPPTSSAGLRPGGEQVVEVLRPWPWCDLHAGSLHTSVLTSCLCLLPPPYTWNPINLSVLIP